MQIGCLRAKCPVVLLLALLGCGAKAAPSPAVAADDLAPGTAVDAGSDSPDTAATADDTAMPDSADSQTGDGASPDADSTAAKPTAWPVAAAGPYVCGFRIVQLTYTLPGTLGERTLPLHIWYPATAAEGDHPAYLGAYVDSHAYTDAPLAAPAYAGGYPLLVHSHGYQGFSGNSATYMCHLATHGWVALAPEHVGNTLVDTPPKLPLVASLQRPLDVRATLDWAAKAPATDPLAGHLDLGHVGMSGHSFGTYTVWATAGAPFDLKKIEARCLAGSWPDCTPELIAAFGGPLADPRPLTFIALAGDGGDLFVAGGRNTVKKPVLQMNGTLDDSGQTALYADVTGVDLTWVDVTGGCHQLYGLGNNIKGDPACKQLADEDGFAIVKPWFLAWLRYHVLGDRGAEVTGIVTGSVSVSPLMKFAHKTPTQ